MAGKVLYARTEIFCKYYNAALECVKMLFQSKRTIMIANNVLCVISKNILWYIVIELTECI